MNGIRSELSKLDVRMEKKKIIWLFIFAQLCITILSVWTVHNEKGYARDNEVIMKISSGGIATYKGEIEVDGKYKIQDGKYTVDDSYEQSISRVKKGEIRYARDGFVYREYIAGINRLVIYEYKWNNTPINKEVTTLGLIEIKNIKMYLVSMMLVGNIMDIFVIYIMIAFLGKLGEKLYLRVLPTVVIYFIAKPGMTMATRERMKLSWGELLTQRSIKGKEIGVLNISTSIIIGLVGMRGYLPGNINFTEFLIGYITMYTLVWVIIAMGIYLEGKRIERELLS